MIAPTSAIILAGGMGTRLRHVLPDIPKPMAPVRGKPFLEYILRYLIRQECHKVILSVGHLHEQIQDYFGEEYEQLQLHYLVEKYALGTGGAIKACLNTLSPEEDVWIVNGDTYFPIDMQFMAIEHLKNKATITIALKAMEKFSRYGSVAIDPSHMITQFNEKNYCEKGFINGGIYLCNASMINNLPEVDVFSFETDFLNQQTETKNIYGYTEDAYFIDIGIPEDYARAESELPDW
ncbi:MAG: nucleotidyltransferase family protein [Bacteroidota bacterium]|jgi:D-glycero-alpha-D-manno-heptose 1-phosphate guanylyltransferase